jgi:hypothetical protein
MDTFREILEMSVGVRSEDGRRFIRTREYTEEFMQTEAYSELFMALVTDAEFGAEFVKGLLPADLAAQAEARLAEEEREYTHEELLGLSDEEFARVAGNDPRHMSRSHLLVAMERKNRPTHTVRVPSAL